MKKFKRKRMITGVLLCLLFSYFLTFASRAEDDDDDQSSGKRFDVKGTSSFYENDRYVTVSLSAKNNGEDFGGYVKLKVTNGQYGVGSVQFERYVSVASGTTENIEFSFPVPEGADPRNYNAEVSIVSDKGTVANYTKLRHIFDADTSLKFGIISDAADKLDFIEDGLAGNYGTYTYYGNNNNQPEYKAVNLMTAELTDGSTLQKMGLLFIDDYDTTTLPAEAVTAIQDWVSAGGILVIGTGPYLSDCMEAFDDDFLDAKLGSQRTRQDYSYYGLYGTLDLADISYGSSYVSYAFGYDINSRQYNKGSVVLLPFTMTDPNLDHDIFSVQFLSDISSRMSTSGSVGSHFVLSDYELGRAFGVLQGKGSMNGGLLRCIIIVYVAAVGPVLYLVLKKLNKREKMWIVIPAMSLAFTILVFFASRGFNISSRQLYSVRVDPADGNGNSVDYLMGYSSGRQNWSVELNDDRFIAAGPVIFNGDYSSNEDHYDYAVVTDTKGSRLVFSPTQLFDEAYFKISRTTKEDRGELEFEAEAKSVGGFKGSLENDTDNDLALVLVVHDGYYEIVEDLKSGKSVALGKKTSKRYGDESDIAVIARDRYDRGDLREARMYVALFMAAHELNNQDSFAVGVYQGKDRVSRGTYPETVYQCLYSVN